MAVPHAYGPEFLAFPSESEVYTALKPLPSLALLSSLSGRTGDLENQSR